MKIKYFDNAATTQVNQDVIKEMLPYFSIEYGNPSSLYSIGRRAKRALEEARRKIANIKIANQMKYILHHAELKAIIWQ